MNAALVHHLIMGTSLEQSHAELSTLTLVLAQLAMSQNVSLLREKRSGQTCCPGSFEQELRQGALQGVRIKYLIEELGAGRWRYFDQPLCSAEDAFADVSFQTPVLRSSLSAYREFSGSNRRVGIVRLPTQIQFAALTDLNQHGNCLQQPFSKQRFGSHNRVPRLTISSGQALIGDPSQVGRIESGKKRLSTRKVLGDQLFSIANELLRTHSLVAAEATYATISLALTILSGESILSRNIRVPRA